jgi:hypothetical protein
MTAPHAILRHAARLALGCIAVSAAGLQARHAQLRGQLASNAFGRELVLFAEEGANEQKGDVYGIVYHPFPQVQDALLQAHSWCDVLILPFNTKHCFARPGETNKLAIRIGRKADQPAEKAYPIDFDYRVVARGADYLRVVLNSPTGPVGTRDYRIALEATPIDRDRTFIHLGFSYGFNTISRLAMQAYLGTIGASKVGFTVTGRDAQGKPVYVGGMLGATERNTMRYFLAIDAYLASLSVPAGARIEKRLGDWFAATEKYPLQLHEMDRAEYVAMKQKETQRSMVALGGG